MRDKHSFTLTIQSQINFNEQTTGGANCTYDLNADMKLKLNIRFSAILFENDENWMERVR